MTERLLVKNKLPVWLGKRTPSPNVPTTTGNRWIDGTAGGSLTDNQYGFFAITGVGNMEYSIEDCAVKIAATSATGRGRVMSAPFEVSTTKQNVNQYAFKLLPSTSYTFRFKAKGIGLLAASARAAIRTFGPQGTSISTFYATDLPAGDSEYQNFEVTFTTGATTAFGIIYMEILPAGAVASAFFKDFELDLTAGSSRANSSNRSTASIRMTIRDMGTALRFDGVNNRVFFPTALPEIIQDSPLTIAFDLTVNDLSDGTIFASRIGTTTQNIHFGWRASSRRLEGAFFTAGAPNVYKGRFATPRLAHNKTYNIAIVYDGSPLNEGTDGTDIYIDGVLQPRVSANFGGAGATDGMCIGAQTSLANFLAAVVDNFRIFGVGLTADEVYNYHFNGIFSRDNLLLECLFDEATGTTALDTSGNGNDGTITGATYTTDTPLKLRTIV